MDLSDYLLAGLGIVLTLAAGIVFFIFLIARAYADGASGGSGDWSRAYWILPIGGLILGVLITMAGCQG